MDNSKRILELVAIIQTAKDPLIEFVMHPYRDELLALRQANLVSLLEVAKQLGIRYISVSKSEIRGYENIRYNGWPAVWEVATILGIDNSCGNTDQRQITYNMWFEESALGMYDARASRKLSCKEYESLNFR